jgi:hypothetical protein
MEAVAVYATWRLAQELFPTRLVLPLVAAASMAFVPSFLAVAGVYHPDNLANALAALFLWQAVVYLRRPGWRRAILLGALVGAMTLSKMMVGLAFVPLLPLIASLARTSWRNRLTGLMGSLGIFGALAGPWFVWNKLFIDQLTAVRGSELQLPPPGEWANALFRLFIELRAEWGNSDSLLWHGFVLAFGGQDTYAPAFVYESFFLVGQVCLLGLAVAAVRYRAVWRIWLPPVLILAAAIAGQAAASAVFSLSQGQGAPGRYLFPSLPALALAIAIGLSAWLPRRLQPAITAAPVALLVLAIATPFKLIQPTYALANQLSASDLPAPSDDARFDNRIELAGARIDGNRLASDHQVDVRIAWHALDDIDRSYRVFVQLLAPDGHALVQVDRVPAQGRASTALWRSGATVFDDFTLNLPDTPPPGLYRVGTGFYRLADLSRLKVTGSAALPGDAALVGMVKVLEPVAPASGPAIATFGDQLALLDAKFDAAPRAAAPLAVRLTWRAVQPIRASYTVSLQLLDPADRLVAQRDAPPLNGALPTTAWDQGDVIPDSMSLDLPAEAPPVLRLLLVVYDSATGQRLPVDSGRDALDLGAINPHL